MVSAAWQSRLQQPCNNRSRLLRALTSFVCLWLCVCACASVCLCACACVPVPVCSMRLLQNTSRGIGDLILIYKRMTGLAGHTSRVAELLEQVRPQHSYGLVLCAAHT